MCTQNHTHVTKSITLCTTICNVYSDTQTLTHLQFEKRTHTPIANRRTLESLQKLKLFACVAQGGNLPRDYLRASERAGLQLFHSI